MNQATNPLKEPLERGWSIQIYSADRRLLFSLYPSHGSAFLVGIVLGFFIAMIGIRNPSPPPSSPASISVEAPFQLE